MLPYCYGLAVLLGLSIATPISWARTFFQVGVGTAVMVVLQTFGVVGELLKKLGFEIGPAVHAALVAEGFPAEAQQAAVNAGAGVSRPLQGTARARADRLVVSVLAT